MSEETRIKELGDRLAVYCGVLDGPISFEELAHFILKETAALTADKARLERQLEEAEKIIDRIIKCPTQEGTQKRAEAEAYRKRFPLAASTLEAIEQENK